MTDLPDLPDPDHGSREHTDRLAFDTVARIERELIPLLEAMGRHSEARRWRLISEITRASSDAQTLDELEALGAAIIALQPGDEA